ncbi:MAG: hypothetical protein RLP44_17325 [Aggregatilineales bacterium]
MVEPIRQREWTDEELIAEGFQYYERKKQLVMAARLPNHKAPLRIDYPSETVYAQAGDIIIFDPGMMPMRRLGGYDFWSVKPDVFVNTYRKWDVTGWYPNPQERYLMEHGCQPYFKQAGVWARHLKEPTPIVGLESHDVAIIPPGMWLAIGQRGEPWHIDPQTFSTRYTLANANRA